LAALELVEMAAFAERPAPALSGGQQQRVAMARALVSEPRVLLLDEPLSNLDARLRTQMGDEFRALQKRLQITTVYVTHDQIEAMSLSDRVVVMGAGRILQIGAPRDIYLHPNTTEVARFFGSPNILEGTVRSCRPVCGSHYETEIAGRGWQGVCRAGEPLAAGTSIHMIARPESLMLQTDTSPRDDAVQLAGVVRELIFRGTHCTVVFETEAGLLNAQVPPITTPQIGEQVRFGIEPAATWAVRD
ncbi:MAG: ABC transporter ATP-binding protein, partial [Burkholderiaceae bacterium]